MNKKSLKRTLRRYFSKLKKAPSNNRKRRHHPPPVSGGIFSACMYPRLSSCNAYDNNIHSVAVSSGLQTLFLDDTDEPHYKPRNDDDAELSFTSMSESQEGSSTSESQEGSVLSTVASELTEMESANGTTVLVRTNSPHEAFRRSMQEVVDRRPEEARHVLDWEYMEELLALHLELNETDVHKHILSAFVDLTNSFRSRPPSPTNNLPSESCEEADKLVSVTIYAKEPYDEFLRSMKEMIDGWLEDEQHHMNWEFMEDVLQWHLENNEYIVHKHVLRAFVEAANIFRRREGAEATGRTMKKIEE